MLGTQHAAPPPKTKMRRTAGMAVRGNTPRMSGSKTRWNVVSHSSVPISAILARPRLASGAGCRRDAKCERTGWRIGEIGMGTDSGLAEMRRRAE